MTIKISDMSAGELADWGALRRRLWPTMTDAENRAEVAAYGAGTSPVRRVILAADGGRKIGFAEVSERNLADECGRQPVAYLEGWYVDPDYQRRGVGLRLIDAVTQWASSVGYAYLASDTQIANAAGQRAHRAAGFGETSRAVLYRKRLR